jgi:antitoxin (DNA-binding transcriptional repressor) of toxin-antitoxin stability system
MQSIGAYEAKIKLSSLLKKVGKGETITITRRGKPVAELRQPGGRDNANVAETIAAIRAHRKNFARAFEGVSIKELIKEGRR